MARAARPDQKNIQLNPGAPSVRVCRGYAPPDYSLFSPQTLPAKAATAAKIAKLAKIAKIAKIARFPKTENKAYHNI